MSDLSNIDQWEDGEFEWELKYYYSVPLSVFFGKPNKLFENANRLRAEIATKGYEPPEDAMMLMEVELFKGRLLMQVPKPQEYDASVVEIEKSKWFSAIHKGPFKTIKQTAKALTSKVESRKGVRPTATYYWDFRHGPEFTGQRNDKFVVFCRL